MTFRRYTKSRRKKITDDNFKRKAKELDLTHIIEEGENHRKEIGGGREREEDQDR